VRPPERDRQRHARWPGRRSSNLDDRNPNDVTLEQAYLAAIGEDLLPLEQNSVLALSLGRQDYKVGTGFLFYDGGTDGGRRGAYWIDRRKAFEFVGRGMLTLGDVFGEVVYLDANETDPDTNTKLAGSISSSRSTSWSSEPATTTSSTPMFPRATACRCSTCGSMPRSSTSR
jgi:hypothetical protein